MAGTAPKTSASHPLRVATIEVGAGRIGVTFCPGKKQHNAISGAWERDLAFDLDALLAWGAKHLVTLTEDHELIDLKVANLGALAAQMGLRWHHVPIRDGEAPDSRFEQRWIAVQAELLQSLQDGGGVVIHCKGGLGRAGTIAARILLEFDATLPAAEAIARVRAVRPGAIETPAQERYLQGLRM